MIAGPALNITAVSTVDATFAESFHFSIVEQIYNQSGLTIYSELQMDLNTSIQIINDEINRRNTLGYGMGVTLGRLIGTHNENIDKNTISTTDVRITSSGSAISNFFNYAKSKAVTFIEVSLNAIKFFQNSYYGYSPLHLAVLNNDLGSIQTAVSECFEDIYSRDIMGRTPVYYVMKAGNNMALKILIDAGLPLSFMINPQTSALKVALKTKNRIASDMLLAQCINSNNECSAVIKNAFDCVIKDHDVDSFKYLLNKNLISIKGILVSTIDAGNPQMFDYLLQYSNIDLEIIFQHCSKHYGQTLLEYFLIHNQFEMANILKAHGAPSLNKKVILFITDSTRNARMYQQARAYVNTLGNDFLGVTISISKENIGPLSRQDSIISELNNIKRQLPPDASFIQAVLNSGITEIETIKHYAKQAFQHSDSIWISGGDNIWEGWYRETEQGCSDIWRDILEIAILDLQQNDTYKPLLGVCRGNQMINVFHGGSLRNEGEYGNNPLVINSNQGILGSVELDNPLGWSSHAQSIDKLADNLNVVMSSTTGMIKAIQSSSNELPLMGTQFHPETASHAKSTGRIILNQFRKAVDAAKEQSCLAFDLAEQRSEFENQFYRAILDSNLDELHRLLRGSSLTQTQSDTLNRLLDIREILVAILNNHKILNWALGCKEIKFFDRLVMNPSICANINKDSWVTILHYAYTQPENFTNLIEIPTAIGVVTATPPHSFLIWAVTNNRIDLVNICLANKHILHDVSNSNISDYLLLAMKLNHIEIMNCFLEIEAVMAKIAEDNFNGILKAAILIGHTDIISRLLEIESVASTAAQDEYLQEYFRNLPVRP